jgi:carbamoyl-phosphate synthase large subunit
MKRSLLIRQSVLRNNVAYFTTIAAARATALAIKELKAIDGELEPKALQDYLA